MNERMKLIKEVQILSRLTHPNIVRYYNSWVEYQNADWFTENVSSEESDEESENEQKSDSFSSVDIVFTDNLTSNSGKKQIAPKCCSTAKEAQNPGIIYVYMQMEYCEKKSLREVIDNSAIFKNDKCIWQFFRDICSGLAYIHSQGMIHRDIKPENILISSINNAKIVDFNLSTIGLFHKPVFEFVASRIEKDPAIRASYTNISRSLLQKDPSARMSANDLIMTSLYPTPIEDININK
ncbi:hypothetical protein MXB_1952, partial [Myxobolus squamalis]